jgi:hypothetical protein
MVGVNGFRVQGSPFRVQMKVEFPLRYRLSETLITLLTINASTFERYQFLLTVKNICLLFAMFSYLIFKYSNTNALIEMSLRVKRSNLTENEIAMPFGLAMTM